MDSPFEKEIIDKDPDFILDYSLSWATWLGAETIATSLWTVPAGITMVSTSNTTTVVSFRLSGGSLNNDYELINNITTAPSGQASQRAVIIHMVSVESLSSILDATVGGASSNSYGTLAEAKTYFLRRLYTSAWNGATDEEREAALLMACQRLEQEDYIGEKVTLTQALKWPRRSSSYSYYGFAFEDLNGNGYPSDVVIQPMKYAQFELAHYHLSLKAGISGKAFSTAGLKTVDFGPITLDFGASSGNLSGDTIPVSAMQYLRGLVITATRVVRG